MAENPDEDSSSSFKSPAASTASSSPSVCVLVTNIPMYCGSLDVAKCLEAQADSLSIVSDVHVVPTQSGGNASSPATQHAVLAVNASSVEGKSNSEFSNKN